MNSDFEDYLSRQRFRPIPPEWREKILPAAPVKNTESSPAPWWREWLWPNPQAWIGLAAAWGVVFLLHFTAPVDTESAAKVAPVSMQAVLRLQNEMEIMAQLPDTTPAPAIAPRPRTCRQLKLGIG